MKRGVPVGALVTLLGGAAAVAEAVRLEPLRTSDYGGDHVIIGLMGGILLMLGLLLLLQQRRRRNAPPAGAEPVEREDVQMLVLTLGVLIAYGLLLPWLGYVASTLLSATLLFRVLGRDRWWRAALLAVLVTGCLYAIFVLGLQMVFPPGLLDFA